MKKDIGNFKVPVNHIFLWEVEKPWENIFDNGLGILLWEVMLSSEFGLKVATVAEFSYDVAISIGSEDLEALKNIWMIKFFEHIDLLKK